MQTGDFRGKRTKNNLNEVSKTIAAYPLLVHMKNGALGARNDDLYAGVHALSTEGDERAR